MLSTALLQKRTYSVRKSEMDKLDKIWSLKVRERGHCESCGRPAHLWRMEAAHIVGRRYRTTRWGVWIDGEYDLNGMCLCHVCHRGFDEHMAIEKEIREKVIGLDRYNKLLSAKEVIAKKQDFDKIKNDIKNASIDRDTKL